MSSTEDRFWSKVDVGEPGACWPWTGSLTYDGYGQIRMNRKTTRLTHRVSWMLEHGSFPDACVCHTCDNRRCVNPAHLWLGSRVDNNADRDRKGRQRSGARYGADNARAILSEAAVREIRQLLAHGVSQYVVADLFGVHRSTIAGIAQGRRWAHV